MDLDEEIGYSMKENLR